MTNDPSDALRRSAAGPSAHPGPLGPYETSYDVRRGYDEPGGPPPGPVSRHRPEPVWIGRQRER